MAERFTLRMQRVLQEAAQESARLKHNRIGSEHILLGMLKEGDGVGAHALRQLRVEPTRLARTVERAFRRKKEKELLAEVPLDRSAQRALRRAAQEAAILGHTYVGTEHLLLALLRERSPAGRILRRFHVDRRRVKEQIRQLLFASQPS